MLNTKLLAPAMNRNIVSREPLLAKLRRAADCRLTLVTAPAGYGKTTAVLDWLKKCGMPSAWLSLDGQDNDPATFWRYVFAALEGIAGGIGKDAEYVFFSQELMAANVHLSILIDRLSEASGGFLLVLDDLHLITDRTILAGLSYLIDYLPEKMHMVFICRTEPELDLARHRVRWQIQRLGEEDLRFGSKDIYRFYAARGHSLPEDDIEKVALYTEGWVAAMVAVAMSMESGGAGSGAVAALARSGRDIEQYLKDEVLSAWSARRRNFAMKTCMLDMLSIPLCDAVTQRGDSAEMLREIGRGSGFLVALDEQRHEYRYHPLFRQLLREMLGQTAPREIPGLYARAGCWYREQGMIPEAIEYFLAGGSFQDAFELLEHRIDDLIDQKDFGRLLAWIERLPDTFRDSSFKVAVIYAMYYAEIGRYGQARQWIGRMKALVNGYPYARGPEWSGYSRTVCAMAEANLLLREGNADFVSHVLSAAEADGGRFYKMPAYSDFNTADIYFYRCPARAMIALFRASPDIYHRAIESYRAMISRNPGYAPLGIGEYLYESDRLEEALPPLLKAVEEAREAGCAGAFVPAMVDIARIKRAQGDIAGATDVLEECGRHLQGSGKPHWIYLLHAFQLRLSVDTGDMDKAREWISSGKPGVFSEIDRVNEFELIVHARALLALGREQDAGLLLQRLLAFTGDNARTHSRVEVLNLLALLSFRYHRPLAAFRYMDESLEIGCREGYVRSYLDELSPMASLLRAYIRSRRKPEGEDGLKERRAFALDLLRRMRAGLPQAEAASGLAGTALERLTPQETNVLRLMANAATNREISEELGIGLRTVKAHAGNIYGKLGLKNRAQCIKLVRELELP